MRMKIRDLTGQKFGRLTAIRQVGPDPTGKQHQARWLFACDCGTEIERFGFYVVHKGQKSCGCYQKDHPARQTHGMTATPVYRAWQNMHKRCSDPNNKRYEHYGGRGIRVCERWGSFENFFVDMGLPPHGLTLDRRDNDGPYCLENCRWATGKEQVRNRSVSLNYEYLGETKSLLEWGEQFGLPYKTLHARYARLGWRGEKLFSPLRGWSPLRRKA